MQYGLRRQYRTQTERRECIRCLGQCHLGPQVFGGQCHLGPRHFQASNCVVIKVGTELLGGFWGESRLDQLGAGFLLCPRDHQRWQGYQLWGFLYTQTLGHSSEPSSKSAGILERFWTGVDSDHWSRKIRRPCPQRYLPNIWCQTIDSQSPVGDESWPWDLQDGKKELTSACYPRTYTCYPLIVTCETTCMHPHTCTYKINTQM